MRKTIPMLMLAMSILTSCREVTMSDEDFHEENREYSPDSSMVLIMYNSDLGAFGYSQSTTAVLRTSDTTKNLSDFSVPLTLKNLKWLDNKSISAQVDILPSIRSGEKIEIKDIEVNNVKIRVSALDYIEAGDHVEVEHREASPDRKYELVAYRYLKDGSNLKILHVSLIPFGGQIPRYGNYFISDTYSDCMRFGTWSKDNELIFYSNESYADFIQYLLVNDRPSIKCHVVKDKNQYGSIWWTK